MWAVMEGNVTDLSQATSTGVGVFIIFAQLFQSF